MKPRIALLFILSASLSAAFCQQKTGKGNIILSLGPSLPVRDFGSKNIFNDKAGFARTGGSMAITYTRLLTKKIGYQVTLQGQTNPLAVSSIEKSFAELPFSINVFFGTSMDPGGPLPPVPAPGDKYPNWQFEKKSWWESSLMLGIYGEFPLNTTGTTVFTASVAAGPSYVSAPAVKGSSIGTTSSAYHEQTGGKGWGVAYDVNAALRHYFKGKVSLQFAAGHFTVPSVKFKNITAVMTTTKGQPGDPDFSISQARITGTAIQTISSLNLGFGIGISL